MRLKRIVHELGFSSITLHLAIFYYDKILVADDKNILNVDILSYVCFLLAGIFNNKYFSKIWRE
jgi:hypothetical protein